MLNHSANSNQPYDNVSNLIITALRIMEVGCKNSLRQYSSIDRVRHIPQSSINV